MTKRKNVALFGGSFNPPHEGHCEIVRRLARRKTIDEVWILPVWRHPFRKKLPSFNQRVALCRQYFVTKRYPVPFGQTKIKVRTYERRLGATGYTADLLTFLTRKFPYYRFWWVMGQDTFRQTRQWRDFATVRQLARLIVFPRGPRSPIPNVSSTALRKHLSPK